MPKGVPRLRFGDPVPARTQPTVRHGGRRNYGTCAGDSPGRRDGRTRGAARGRPGTPGPRSGRHHTREDAGRPAHRADRGRRHGGRLPARRGRRRGVPARGAPLRPGPRGLRLVQPHLRQRHPRPVAVAAALHGGQPRPLDAPRRARPKTDGAPVRTAGTTRRTEPDGAAHRRRLRGRPGPGRLAVRGHPRLRRTPHLAGLPVARCPAPRLVEPARPQAGPGRRGARRARRPAVVPLPAHLERLRVHAAAGPRARARGGRRAHRPGPARFLVRAPAGGPTARRAHRRGAADGRRGRRHVGGAPRPPARRTRGARRGGTAPGDGAPPGRGGGGRGRLPPRAHRAPPRPRPGRAHRPAAAARLPGPAAALPAVRRLGTPGVEVGGPAAGRRGLRRPGPGTGPARDRPRRDRPHPPPEFPRRPTRGHARPGRARGRDAGLRAGRCDVRRRRPAGGGLAGRHRRVPARAADRADLAGVRHPGLPRGAAGALCRAGPAHLATGPRRTRRGGAGLRLRARRPGPHPDHRHRTCHGRLHRPRPPPRRRGRRHHAPARRRGTGRRPHHRPSARGGHHGRAPVPARCRADRTGPGLLADRPRLHPVRHMGPARLPGHLRAAHHRHPVGRRHLLAARRPPLRPALLRRARGARPDLARGHLDPCHRRAAGHLRALPGQRARRRRGLAAEAVRPQTRRPADLRLPAGASLRPLVPRPLRPGRPRQAAPGGRLLAQPVPAHRPHRRSGAPAPRQRPRGGPRAAEGPRRVRPHRAPSAARARPGPLRLPGRPGVRRGAAAAAGPAAAGAAGPAPHRGPARRGTERRGPGRRGPRRPGPGRRGPGGQVRDGAGQDGGGRDGGVQGSSGRSSA